MAEDIPLGNAEVLKVLKGRTNVSDNIREIIEYIESVKKDNVYPMEKLRDLKTSVQLEASLVQLAILSNTNDEKLVNVQDLTKIKNATT